MKFPLPKTVNKREVVPGKLYEVKYFKENEWHYGITRIMQTRLTSDFCDIILNNGGLTYQEIKNVVWLKQVKQ